MRAAQVPARARRRSAESAPWCVSYGGNGACALWGVGGARCVEPSFVPVPSPPCHQLEDQMKVFANEPEARKIIIATNVAESSITLPDCDHVICLGTANRTKYDDRRRVVTLAPQWISQASAVQRAGRTARVRPGTVWRLYTEDFFGTMDRYEPPEMQTMPLDHTVLQLRSSLKQSLIPVLENVLSPPNLTLIGACTRGGGVISYRAVQSCRVVSGKRLQRRLWVSALAPRPTMPGRNPPPPPHRSVATWTHLANDEGSCPPLCGTDTEE